MAEKSRKRPAVGKAVKVRKPKAALMIKGVEALVPSKAPGKLATLKKPARAAKNPTTFTLDAPQATRVFIAGSFNGWDSLATPLQRGTTGLWSRTVSLEPGRHEYRFVVDDVWSDDPMNAMRSWNEFGVQNCIVIIE
jgi:hypothetical protein